MSLNIYTNFSVTISKSVSVLDGQLADGHGLNTYMVRQIF